MVAGSFVRWVFASFIVFYHYYIKMGELLKENMKKINKIAVNYGNF